MQGRQSTQSLRGVRAVMSAAPQVEGCALAHRPTLGAAPRSAPSQMESDVSTDARVRHDVIDEMGAELVPDSGRAEAEVPDGTDSSIEQVDSAAERHVAERAAYQATGQEATGTATATGPGIERSGPLSDDTDWVQEVRRSLEHDPDNNQQVESGRGAKNLAARTQCSRCQRRNRRNSKDHERARCRRNERTVLARAEDAHDRRPGAGDVPADHRH